MGRITLHPDDVTVLRAADGHVLGYQVERSLLDGRQWPIDPLAVARTYWPDAVEAAWDDLTHRVLSVRRADNTRHVVVDLVVVPLDA